MWTADVTSQSRVDAEFRVAHRRVLLLLRLVKKCESPEGSPSAPGLRAKLNAPSCRQRYRRVMGGVRGMRPFGGSGPTADPKTGPFTLRVVNIIKPLICLQLSIVQISLLPITSWAGHSPFFFWRALREKL